MVAGKLSMEAKPPIRPELGIGAGVRSLPHSSSVLVLVDFINPLQFEGADTLAPAALKAARGAASLKARLEGEGVPAIYANDNYGVWQSEFRDMLHYCQGLPGEAGEMARVLAPAKDDLTILKPRHSAFYATPLDLLLTQIKARRLVLAGLATDMCVQLTAMDAYLRGYEIWVPADCTAAESNEEKREALDYMSRVLRCAIHSSTEAPNGTPIAQGNGSQSDLA